MAVEHVVELYPVITPTQNACVPSIKEKAYHLRECDSVVLGRGPSWAEKPKLDDGVSRPSPLFLPPPGLPSSVNSLY
jgi:hypothetical protein